MSRLKEFNLVLLESKKWEEGTGSRTQLLFTSLVELLDSLNHVL